MSLDSRAGLARTLSIVAVLSLVVTAVVLVTLLHPGGKRVTAYFATTIGVYPGNDVRVLGVPVGSITSVQPQGEVVRVDMQIEDGQLRIPADAQAVVVGPSLVSDRYVQLTPVYTTGPELPDGAVIPRERTAVPLELDDVFRNLDKISESLGPGGANAQGSLSQLLDVGAQNLQGNGTALGNTIDNLGQATETLAGSRDDLFGSINNLQSFTTNLALNDAQVRTFNDQLAEVNGLLAAERADLGLALEQLSIALADVSAFVQDNRAVLQSNVDKLVDVSGVLVAQRDALVEVADVAPAALGNLINAGNSASGTLDARVDILELEQLETDPTGAICELLARAAPEPLPTVIGQLCGAIGAAQSDELRPQDIALLTALPEQSEGGR